MSRSIVKFYEKHDGEVAVSVRPIVLQLRKIFCKNGTRAPKNGGSWLFSTVMHCSVLFCTVLYISVLFSILRTVLGCSRLFSTFLDCSALFCTILDFCSVLFWIVLDRDVLNCSGLFCVVLNYFQLFWAVLDCFGGTNLSISFVICYWSSM